MPVGPGALLPALSSPLAPYSAVSALSPERVPPPLHFHRFFFPLKIDLITLLLSVYVCLTRRVGGR